MRPEDTQVDKTQTIDPLDPIGATRPPHKEGGDLETHMPKSDIPKESLVHDPEDYEPTPDLENERTKEIDYKGDRNAPLEAEHPLANPPQVPEAENPRD